MKEFDKHRKMEKDRNIAPGFELPNTADYEWQIVSDCIMFPNNIATLQSSNMCCLFETAAAKKAIETLCKLYDENPKYTLIEAKGRLQDLLKQANINMGEFAMNDGTDIEYHLQSLQLESLRLQVCKMSYKQLQAAQDKSMSYDELLAIPGSYLEDLGRIIPGKDKGQNTQQILTDYIQQLEEELNGSRRNVTTGYAGLDEITNGGFKPGQLIVVAGRPGSGKSVTMLQAATAAAAAGHNVVIFNTEMTNIEQAKRMLLSQGLKVSDLQDISKIDASADGLCSLPITFYDKATKLDEIVSNIRYRRNKGQADIVFIDYLGMIEKPGKRTTAEELGHITGTLKRLAQQLGIPIVLMCQLNRNCENEQRNPRLSDLRDSGAIEQDSDVVILLAKDIPDVPEYRTEDITIRQLVVKQRAGRAGLCNILHPNSTYSRFVETGTITTID